MSRPVRLGRRRLAAVPNPEPEPPACNLLTRGGEWCVRPEGHRGGHLPLPANYPPQPVALDIRVDRARKHDGGPSVNEYLRSRGEL